MKQRFICAALVTLALPAPALAQAPYPQGVLPPYEIAAAVRAAGLDPLTRPVRRGPRYVLRAVDDTDREMRVVVDAWTGRLRSVMPVVTASRLPPGAPYGADELDDAAPPRAYYRGAPVIDEDEAAATDPRGPRPPAAIPGAAPPPMLGNNARAGSDNAIAPRAPALSSVAPRDSTPSQNGLLPPPPDRFPRRAVEKPKPKAKPRTAAVPKTAPLPKAKPSAPAVPSSPAPSAPKQAAPAPAASAPGYNAPAEETPN